MIHQCKSPRAVADRIRRRSSRADRPRLEQLERRELLTAGGSVAPPTLYVSVLLPGANGTGASLVTFQEVAPGSSDTLSLSVDPTSGNFEYNWENNGYTTQLGLQYVNGSLVPIAFPPSEIEQISVTLGASSDVLTIDNSNGSVVPPGGLTLDGGPGSSSLVIEGNSSSNPITTQVVSLAPTTSGTSTITLNGAPITLSNFVNIADVTSSNTLNVVDLNTANDSLSLRDYNPATDAPLTDSSTPSSLVATTLVGSGPLFSFSNQPNVNITTGSGNDSISIDTTEQTTNLQSLNITAGGGNDSFSALSIPSGIAYVLDGGSGTSTFSGDFATFDGDLTLQNFQDVTQYSTLTPGIVFVTTGDFSGAVYSVNDPSATQEFTIGGSMLKGSSITAISIDQLLVTTEIDGDVTAVENLNIPGSGVIHTIKAYDQGADSSIDAGSIGAETFTQNMAGSTTAKGAGTIGTVTVGGDMSGTIYAPEDTNSGSGTVSSVNVTGSFTGSLNTGTLTEISVGSNLTGSVTAQGAGTIGTVTVGGDMSGTIYAPEDSTSGSGYIDSVNVSESLTGSVSTGTITEVSVGSNLTGTVTAQGAGTIGTVTVGGDMSGTIYAPEDTNSGSGTISSVNVTGSFTGSLNTGTLTEISVGSNLTGSVTAQGAGTIGTVTVGGDMSGTIYAPEDTNSGSGTVSSVNVTGSFTGSLNSGTITEVSVGSNLTGSVTAQGAGLLGKVTVGGYLSGELIANDLINGSLGAINQVIIGQSLDNTAQIVTVNLGSLEIGGDLAGSVKASQAIQSINVGGSTSGSIVTSLIENLNAPNAVGPVVFNVTIGGVPYSLVASQTQGASLSGVTFGYAITTPASGIPTLTVHVNNPDPSAIRFNLGVDSGSAAGTMDLALIDSTTGKDAGIDNLVVDGDLLAGGVNLPQDPMLGVAIRNDAAAGSVNALSVESVAFGSVTTTNGVTIPASQANVWTAYDLLAPGTGLAQANGNFVVDFGLNSPVAQFLVTTPFLGFDFRPILFSDPFSFNSNTNVTAQVDVTIPIFVSQVQSVSFAGSGGSIATSLPIWTSITSTGPLGNVVLSSPLGIVANVTAPSVVGNIEATAGPISSIIQTTSGDLGELITNASGVVIGTTLITADDGGISGEIISRGDLVSSIVSEGSISGVIAAQGDLGSIARDSSGNAIVDSTGSLTRYGTISTNGNFSGQIVALGNSFASIDVGGNWQGRMIVAGAPIAGLAAGREGILGSITINHNITGQGAIVSGGQIGDPTGDSPTSLSVENMNGIVAAIGSIAFGDLDRLNGSVFMNSTGANAAAIDAILATTSFDSPAGSFNLAGLESILDELADLKVKKGNLIV